jgi:hypothetical protein
VNNTTFLSLPAVDAIAGMLAEIYASNSQVIDILTNWSTGTVQAAESTYTVTSNALSVGGMVGQYTGNVVIPYVKRNLNNLMPYPFVFPWAYPTNMATLETFFLETFNIVLEDGEFAVTGNSISGPLSGSNAIDATPDPTTGYVTLVAQPSSGRFVAGSTINLRCTGAGVQVPLTTLLALSTPPNLDVLTDH